MSKYDFPGYSATPHGFLEPRPGSKGGYHGGADYAAPAGTPVYAEYGGRVFRSGLINGYGMAVVIESTSPNGTKFYQLYGHLGPGPLADPDTPIKAGEPIPGAMVGSEAFVKQFANPNYKGTHLHREIISQSAPINKTGSFGIYSSDRTYKADPDTFDINNPVFPYLNAAPLAAPASRASSPALQSSTGDIAGRAPVANPPGSIPSRLYPGMMIPGAKGPTSIGGPSGPTPLFAPESGHGLYYVSPGADRSESSDINSGPPTLVRTGQSFGWSDIQGNAGNLGGLPGLLARAERDDPAFLQPQPDSWLPSRPTSSLAPWPINQDGQPAENLKPVRYLTRRDVNAPGAWSPPLAPIPSQGPLTLKQAARAWAASQYPQLAYDDPASANAPTQAAPGPTSQMQPPIQPTLPWQTSPSIPGDLGGWVTGLAGVDPQAADQPARSPLDEWLDQYVRQNMSAR